MAGLWPADNADPPRPARTVSHVPPCGPLRLSVCGDERHREPGDEGWMISFAGEQPCRPRSTEEQSDVRREP
jgi:hypothetical protein